MSLTNNATKKGFLNPIILLVIAIIAVFFIFGGQMRDALSAIGISDDYLYYDDFEKGYFDTNLWDFTNSVPKEPFYSSSTNYLRKETVPTIENGWLVARRGHINNGGSQPTGIKEGTLSPKIDMLGKYVKAKVTTQYYGRQNSYNEIASKIRFVMNGKEIITVGESKLGFNNYIVEFLPSFENPNIYTVFVNAEEVKTVNVTNPSGNKKLEIVFKNDFYTNSEIITKMDYLKYKYPYSCQIADDEILLFDSFAGGSTVNISNLAYEPVKFCLDYPIKARSFTEDGIKTDIRGEILQKIVRGQSAIVPLDEEWKVYYITKYTSGMGLRCDIGQAYNTATKTCDDPIDDAIVGCKSNSDCYIPNGCTGVTAQCVSNSCEYSGACIYQPGGGEGGLWAKIMSLPLFQWISGLFS